jgi:hypothetical protein
MANDQDRGQGDNLGRLRCSPDVQRGGLHEAEHPNNALAIVRHIILHRSGEQPMATGGELTLEIPWKLDPGRLQPIAYRYRTGL